MEASHFLIATSIKETESWRRCERPRVISSGISIYLAQNSSGVKTVKILNKNNVYSSFSKNDTSVTKDFDKASVLNQFFSECINLDFQADMRNLILVITL